MDFPVEIVCKILDFHGSPDGVSVNRYWRIISHSLSFKKHVIRRKFGEICLFSVLYWTNYCGKQAWISSELEDFLLGTPFQLEFQSELQQGLHVLKQVAIVLNGHRSSISLPLLQIAMDTAVDTIHFGNCFAIEGNVELFRAYDSHKRASKYLDFKAICALNYGQYLSHRHLIQRSQKNLTDGFDICLRHGNVDLATRLRQYVKDIGVNRNRRYIEVWCNDTSLLLKPWRIFRYCYFRVSLLINGKEAKEVQWLKV